MRLLDVQLYTSKDPNPPFPHSPQVAIQGPRRGGGVK